LGQGVASLRRACAAAALAAVALHALALLVAPADAKTLRWARSIDTTSLDPHAANTGPNLLIAHHLYEPLIVRQFDGKMVPALATSWTLTRDPLVWEFKLRPGVTFHDGSPLAAEDVLFSLERARSTASDVKSLLSSVASVSKADDQTIRIRTIGPDPLLPNNLTDVFIMSRAWAQANDTARIHAPASGEPTFAATHAVGTGPYRLVSREPGTRTVMKAYEGYWARNEAPLEIEEIVYLPIADNVARITALVTGEVDFVQDVPVADVERLQDNRALRVNTSPENRSMFLGMNVGARDLRSSSLKDKNPFADRRVRAAIEMAIDRQQLRREVMRGQSVPAGVIVPPFSNGYSAELDRWPPVDLGKARALMREAGYGDGFDVALTCTNDRYVNDEGLCHALAAMLGPIGMRVRPVTQPASQHFGQVRRAELDFYLLGWGVTTFDSEYIFSLLYHTNTGALGGWNGTGFSDRAVDDQIHTLRQEVDQTRRNATIAALWRRLKEEVVYVPLHNQTITHAMSREFDIPVDVSNQPKMKFIAARKM
jgi:peptide/nickel transport system substrate-binding protein